MAETVDSHVLGRDEELDRLGRFLDDRSELRGALVVEGEAGIGKTTLWRWAVDRARDRGYRTLVCRPGGAEAGLSYAALGDLLGDALGGALPALSPPQRRAVEVALLLEDADGGWPDQRAVGVGVLAVLRALAAAGPVLLAIDDVQWLDASSAVALEFALRRLHDEPVAVLAARRLGLAGGLELPDAERLPVGPLSIGATHRLLMTRLGTALPRPVLVRLHATSAGNPFFALELGRALLRRDRGAGPGEPVSPPDDLGGLVRERLSGLSPEARAAAAVAAALALPTVGAVVEACDGDRRPLEAAIGAEVLERDGERIRFTHPLLAAGVEAAMWPPDRRALHQRLAGIVVDPEERARHLALAADGPDASVAEALDEAARLAATRGAQAAAAELAELAIRTTPAGHGDDLRRRRLTAAGLHVQTGDIAAARPLLELVVPEAAGAERARSLFLLAQTTFDRTAATDALEQAALLTGADDRLLAEIELERAGWLHTLGDLGAARREAHAALDSARRSGDRLVAAFAVVSSSFLDAMAGEAVDLEGLVDAVRIEQEEVIWPLAYPPSVILGLCLMFADRLDEARALLEAAVVRSAANGNEFARQTSLLHLAESECRAGRYERAAECAEQGLAAAEQMKEGEATAALLYVKALAATYRGRGDEARAAGEAGLALAEKVGDRPFAAQHRGGLGFLELSLGDVAAADRLLRPLWPLVSEMGYGEPSVFPVLPNAVEAMIRVGAHAEARVQLAELERHGARLDSAWALAQAARCRGMLASADGDADAAERHFERALAEDERLPGRFERGRTLLALGAARRRARRRGAARESLVAALAIFEELGASLWAAQAHAELASVGGRPAPAGGLTPTERRVAELVAGGLSTKQVAAALVVSPKTVEGHLSHIYAKLDVHSRTQLAGRLR